MLDTHWLHGILADVQANWFLYASMPLVAAAIGYGTKIAAIYMMFRPLKFIGLKPPYLGWQGIVPRNAERMASIACSARPSWIKPMTALTTTTARITPVSIQCPSSAVIPAAANST